MSIKVNSLSFSTVNQYTQCPERVWMSKVLGLPQKGVSANALMGSSLHAAAESFYRALMLRHRLPADVLFRVFCARYAMTPETDVIYAAKEKEEIFEKARQLLMLLAESEAPYQIVAIEKPVTIQLTPELKIVGKPDLIARDRSGNLVIYDLKSAARRWGEDELQNTARQVFTYALAFSEPVKLRAKVFLKTKTPEIEEIALDAESVNFDEFKILFLMVKKGIESGIHYRVRSWACKTCPYSYVCNAKESEQESELKMAA